MDPKTIIEIQDIATADKLPPSDPAMIEANPNYKSPAERANFFSYINFSFMFKTAQTARKLAKKGKALDSETLPGYSYQRRPEVLEQKFMSHMQRQKKAGLRKKVKLVLALFSTFKWVMLFNTVIGLLQLGLRIWMAWLAMKLLESIGNPYSPVSEGYKWAGILSGVYIIAIYTDHHCYYNTSMASLQIRSGIISMIYTKIMRLSVYSMNQISLGKIVNIVANDINVFERTGLYFLNIVIGFFGLIGCTAVLWIFFGPSCLVGIGYCLLGFPLLGTLAKRANGPLAKKNIVTDERVKMTNEVIDGIRLLKMYAWELIFKNFIMEIREREVKLLKGAANFESLSRGYALSINCVACFLIWMTYVLTGNELSSAIVFPSIFLVGLVRVYCIFFLALALNFTMESKLLLGRIEDIIEATEIGDTKFQEPVDSSNSVEFKDFTAYWTANQEAGTLITEIDKKSLVPQENKSTLSDINLNIKKGSLNAVIGKVGSGKSSFLLAFTGEMPKTEGSLRFKGDIAYVEQEPTIFAGTLRDNILFGKPYEANFYNKVIAACNLENDIKLFPLGDRAEIGEKGVNLSGGQKARLSLARAIYSDADIYLLDDPLSAVDTKVAKSLFEEAIKGLLKGKTVILATHQVHFVRGLENIIVIDDGKVIANGSYESLKQQQNVDMAGMFSSGLKRSTSLRRAGSSPMNNSPTLPAEIIQEIQESSEEEEEEEKSKSDENKGKLFANEDKDGDNVSFQTYKSYLSHMGLPFVVLFFFMYLVSELTNVAFGRVVGVWADGRLEKTTALATVGGLTAFAMVIFVLKILFLNRLLLRASQSLHNKMLDKILKSPVQFFDTNPVGRILNRFSNDTGVLDRFLPLTLGDSIDTMFNVISSLIVIAVINPIALAPICIALILVVIVLLFCYHCIQQSKNYELASRSPLYSLFSSSLAGIVVIRSYKQTENFIKQFRTLLYNNTKGGIAFWTSARFFGLSVDIIYSICAVVSIFIIAATKNNSNAGLAGLSLSSLLGISGILQYSLRQGVQSNVLIASVGRIKAYCNLPSEAALFQPKDEDCKKKNWPQEGKIEFNNVFMKYRANTEYVIRDLTLNAKPGEKIGCVGRTGAGKSSIIQILFRMVEIDRTAQGTEQSYVNIDGVNSQSIGLHTLRNSISIIPQTPFVFTGTVRRNLDPIGQFTDEQLWKVLEDVNLKAHVEKLEKGLYTDMTNASSVFSVGQKQLVCLARAILKQSKLLVLDEATANVDMETDNFIQNKIMEKFSKCTIFTIAHRLSTIANYDKVLVLDKGKKVEFDEPYKLLVKEVGDMTITNKSGYFASMVLNTGPRTSEDILRVARTKYYEKHSSL